MACSPSARTPKPPSRSWLLSKGTGWIVYLHATRVNAGMGIGGE
jgi:hypothetical protein